MFSKFGVKTKPQTVIYVMAGDESPGVVNPTTWWCIGGTGKIKQWLTISRPTLLGLANARRMGVGGVLPAKCSNFGESLRRQFFLGGGYLFN